VKKPKKGKGKGKSHCHTYKKPKSRFPASSHIPSLYRRIMIDSACTKNNTIISTAQHPPISSQQSIQLCGSHLMIEARQSVTSASELIGIDCECMSRHMVVHPASLVPFALVLNDTLAAS